jgi:HK97 gp10 family phage protein
MRPKPRPPVETGALRKSIRMFSEPQDRGGTVRTAYAGSRLHYAYWVEFGTARQAPQPFLRPALDEAGQAAVDKMIENLGAGIERETAKYRGR